MLPFWALMAFTFILLLAPQERFPVLAPLRIALLAAIVATLTHTFSRFAKGLPLVEINSALVIVGSLVGWAILTVPFSYWPGGSVAYLLDTWFKTLIVFVLLANVINTMGKLKGISWGLVLMSVPLALTTIQNFMAGTSYRGSDRTVGYIASLTANPNDMALMLNLILPFGIALFLGTRKAGLRIIIGTILGLQVAAIIATFSRGGFLTLGVICLCYLWLLRNRPERLWGPVIILLLAISVPLIPASYFDRLDTIVNIEDDASGSAQTRWSDMKAATRLALANPLIGAGLGQNQLAMNEVRGTTWTEIHNVYLQYAVELGMPGLLLFMMFYASCMRSTKTVLRHTRGAAGHRELFFIAEGIQVSLLAFAVAAIFHPVAYHFYFYYIAGLAIAVRTVHAAEAGVIGTPVAMARNSQDRS
jgi:probable O-glycosylation ligase (exosortase A-associated)